MIIFYDMDNTITEMSLPLEGIPSEKLTDYYNGSSLTQQEKLEKLHKKGFFKNFKPFKSAIRTIKLMVRLGCDVRIISQPMINNYCIDEKNAWLDRYLPEIPRHKRFFTFDKEILSGQDRILIDDNITHLTKWQQAGGIAIGYERGYNKTFPLLIREHKEILSLLSGGGAYRLG